MTWTGGRVTGSPSSAPGVVERLLGSPEPSVRLKELAEAGFVRNPRCGEALDLLEAKRLADGGFPAEAGYHRLAGAPGSAPRSLVDWDGTGRRRMNQWVTVEALAVLRAAGRSVGLVETSS